MTPNQRIHTLLGGVEHMVIAHDPGGTSAETAALRGTPLELGAKSLVFKTNRGFVLLVVRASDAVHGNTFRKHIGVRRLRFATHDELLELTGLTPGCVPPFGPPVFELPLYVDQAVLDQTELVFTAALHTESVRMATETWRQIAQPTAVRAVSG